MKIKALTISQPWADKIARGEKFVENRTWHTSYIGPLLIHAGLGNQYLTKREMRKQGLVTGAAVAIAELCECVGIDELDGDAPLGSECPYLRCEVYEHQYTEGPVCLVLKNVMAIDPIPMKGFQLFWNAEIPDELFHRWQSEFKR